VLEALRTWSLLRQLRAGVHRSPESLELLQDKMLRAAVTHAHENVPFYRRFWDEAGFDALRFRGIQDLERIPIATSSMIKEAARRGELLANGVDTTRCTYLDSSGSSGQSTRIWKQSPEERLRRAVGLRIWFEHGFRWRYMTAQFQILPGPSHFLQRFGISRKIWLSTDLPIEKQLRQFLAAKADVVVGTPTALRRICRAIAASGERPKPPRLIFGAGELLDNETRAVAAKVFGVEPIGIYGQTEVGYLAWQCERREAFHVNADTHLVEVVRHGRPVNPGELGTIVVTDLRAKTMPFLRYDTTDLAIAGSGQCSCGRKLPIIASIEGRASHSIRLWDDQILTTRQIVNHMAEVLCLGEYRIYQEAVDRIRIELIPITTGNGDKSNIYDRNLETVVLRHLRELFGDLKISMEIAGPWQPDRTGKTHTILSKSLFQA
jgi:phenylacetate-CoA ligase